MSFWRERQTFCILPATNASGIAAVAELVIRLPMQMLIKGKMLIGISKAE